MDDDAIPHGRGDRVQIKTGQGGIVIEPGPPGEVLVHFGIHDGRSIRNSVPISDLVEPEHVVTLEEIKARGDEHLLPGGAMG